MKFYGTPGMLVRPLQRGVLKTARPFRFDSNGEYETDNKYLIRALKVKFRCDDTEVVDVMETTITELNNDGVKILESKTHIDDEEVRRMAKEAGIKSWHVKNIDKLKEELGL